METALQQKNFSVLEKDGVVRTFEFTFEPPWKTLQDILHEKGYTDVKGPKPVIKKSFEDEIINDGQGWIDRLNDRNYSTRSMMKVRCAISLILFR